MTLAPGTERAIFNISQELPRLTAELEKLNQHLSVPSEAASSVIESLRSFRKELVDTFKPESKGEKLVQE